MDAVVQLVERCLQLQDVGKLFSLRSRAEQLDQCCDQVTEVGKLHVLIKCDKHFGHFLVIAAHKEKHSIEMKYPDPGKDQSCS